MLLKLSSGHRSRASLQTRPTPCQGHAGAQGLLDPPGRQRPLDSAQLEPLGIPSPLSFPSGRDNRPSFLEMSPPLSIHFRKAGPGREIGEGLQRQHPVCIRDGLRGYPRGLGLFFPIQQEVFIRRTNKHLGVVAGLGQ